MGDNRAKRQRETKPGEEDFVFKAKIIMDADPFKERAPREFDKAFRALFGCSNQTAFALWNDLEKYGLLPQGGRMVHLLWALMFLKVYPSEETLKRLTGADSKTARKWINSFVAAISSLSVYKVSTYVRAANFFC